MSKNVNEVISYFENLYTNKAIYLWGANGEIITKELCDRLFNSYGSSTYNRTYYDNKLKEGTNKIGADCSGAMYPVSGFDTTAQGYYNKCITKGNISSIPKDTTCLVFKGSSTSAINHIGFYLGNGYIIEMKSSKENCVKSKLEVTIPNIEFNSEKAIKDAQKATKQITNASSSATDNLYIRLKILIMRFELITNTICLSGQYYYKISYVQDSPFLHI